MSDEMHVCPGCGLEYAGDVLMKLRKENDKLLAELDAVKKELDSLKSRVQRGVVLG